VFVNHPDTQNLEDFALSVGLHGVQLHGNETPDYCSMIQRVKVIKALRVGQGFRVDTLRNYGSRTFLLDALGSPTGFGDEPFGGTGRVFDWNQVYGANAFGSIIIAGGLTPSNVSDVVRQLHPFGVDVASGVEASPGKKDYEKMRLFIEAVRRTDVALMGGS
jgi:phosphoribosylanthranilate isomerase